MGIFLLVKRKNLADIFRLKYKNIDGDTIVFVRHKTATTGKRFLYWLKNCRTGRRLLNRWGSKPAIPDNYVFNILTSGLTPAVERAKIQQATKTLNKYIKRIAGNVGISGKVTSYTARHRFATVLKLEGENIAYISEALGHSNLKTTENYLKSFDRATRMKAAKKLL